VLYAVSNPGPGLRGSRTAGFIPSVPVLFRVHPWFNKNGSLRHEGSLHAFTFSDSTPTPAGAVIRPEISTDPPGGCRPPGGYFQTTAPAPS
jgi:hypothetical protein